MPPGALGAMGAGQQTNTPFLSIRHARRNYHLVDLSHIQVPRSRCLCPGYFSVFAPVLHAFGRPPPILFTNGRKVSELGLSDDQIKALQANECRWVESYIARLTPAHIKSTAAQPDPSSAFLPPSRDGLRVELTDGSSVDIGMLHTRPPFVTRH